MSCSLVGLPVYKLSSLSLLCLHLLTYTRKTKLNFCPGVDWQDELKPLFQTVAKATRLSLFCHGFLVKQWH